MVNTADIMANFPILVKAMRNISALSGGAGSGINGLSKLSTIFDDYAISYTRLQSLTSQGSSVVDVTDTDRRNLALTSLLSSASSVINQITNDLETLRSMSLVDVSMLTDYKPRISLPYCVKGNYYVSDVTRATFKYDDETFTYRSVIIGDHYLAEMTSASTLESAHIAFKLVKILKRVSIDPIWGNTARMSRYNVAVKPTFYPRSNDAGLVKRRVKGLTRFSEGEGWISFELSGYDLMSIFDPQIDKSNMFAIEENYIDTNELILSFIEPFIDAYDAQPEMPIDGKLFGIDLLYRAIKHADTSSYSGFSPVKVKSLVIQHDNGLGSGQENSTILWQPSPHDDDSAASLLDIYGVRYLQGAFSRYASAIMNLKEK